MPERNRGQKLAFGIGLVAILAIAAVVTALAAADQKPKPNAPEVPTSTQQQQQRSITAPAPTIPKQEVFAPPVEQQPCPRPKDRDDADLCAQATMANATSKQTEYLYDQNWITGIEAFLLLVTVIFTAKATIAATEGTKTANKAIEQSERHARTELRPYVFADSTEYHWMNPPGKPEEVMYWRLTLICKNSGGTPARNIRAAINIELFATGKTPEDVGFPDHSKPFIISSCGPHQTFVIRIDIPQEKLLSAHRGDGAIYYWAWIEYDGFEKSSRHRTEFCSTVTVHGDPTESKTLFTSTFSTRFNAADEDCVHQVKTTKETGV